MNTPSETETDFITLPEPWERQIDRGLRRNLLICLLLLSILTCGLSMRSVRWHLPGVEAALQSYLPPPSQGDRTL